MLRSPEGGVEESDGYNTVGIFYIAACKLYNNMEYLKIQRLSTDKSGIKLFKQIFLGMMLICFLLLTYIFLAQDIPFKDIILSYALLVIMLLLYWLFIKLCKGEHVIFTDSEIYVTGLFNRKTRTIQHTEIAEIFAYANSINFMATALGSVGSVARPSISSSRVPFSKIVSHNPGIGGTNFIVISKTPNTSLESLLHLLGNKNTIVMHARQEVVDLISKFLPQYIRDNADK